METSINRASGSGSPPPAPTNSRRSGRVVRVPEKFVPGAPAASHTKRKRDAIEADDENDDGNESTPEDRESPTEDEALIDDEHDDDDDSETATEQSRRKSIPPKKKKAAAASVGRAPPPSSRLSKARKPASKKPKTNGNAPYASNGDGDGMPSPTSGAARLPSRPKRKAVRIAVSEDEGNELYGKRAPARRLGRASCFAHLRCPRARCA